MKYFFRSVSGVFFLITVLVLVLQLIPYTGIFLMFLMGPYWSIITLNIAFIALLIECLCGKKPKWVFVFPAVYFGGFLTLALASNAYSLILKNQINSHNESASISFNAKDNDLILTSDIQVAPFLTIYGMKEIKTGQYQNDKGTLYTNNILGTSKQCAEVRSLRANPDFKESYFTRYLRGPREKGNRFSRGKIIKGVCIVGYPSTARKPVIVTKSKSERIKSFLLPRREIKIYLTSAEGKEYELKLGYADPYKWIPLPVLGCGLNSASASWECSAGFIRKMSIPLQEIDHQSAGKVALIANALGLSQVSEEKRYIPSDTDLNLLEMAQNTQKNKKEAAYKRFEDFLSDPVNYSQSLNFEDIEGDRPYFLAKSSQMVDALDQLKNIKDIRRTKRSALSLRLSELPLKELSKHSQGLIRIFSSSNQENWIWHNKELYIRMGDLGAPVHDLFIRTLQQQKVTNFNIALGYAICRAGEDIGPNVKDTLIKLSQKMNGYSMHYRQKRSLFLALARTGYNEEANALFDEGKIKNVNKNVTKDSSASVCVDFKGQPTFK